MCKIVKDYRDNIILRHSFNELAKKTFGLDFEDWYQNGFWSDHYNPYSIVEDHKVIATVSVNKTDMILSGTKPTDERMLKHFLQLGTVMTEESCRNRGYIRILMEEIEKDYAKQDGIYLFANDSVLKFYPKFGFDKALEYQYSKEICNTGECQFEKISMNCHRDWKKLLDAMEHNVFQCRFSMAGNKGLIMFYVTKFMQECVYYNTESDTYLIAEMDGETIFLHNIFSSTLQSLSDVTVLLGKEIKKVTLGFVPMETDGYTPLEYYEDDCTFFVKGNGMDIFHKEKLRIPSLSHA